MSTEFVQCLPGINPIPPTDVGQDSTCVGQISAKVRPIRPTSESTKSGLSLPEGVPASAICCATSAKCGHPLAAEYIYSGVLLEPTRVGGKYRDGVRCRRMKNLGTNRRLPLKTGAVTMCFAAARLSVPMESAACDCLWCAATVKGCTLRPCCITACPELTNFGKRWRSLAGVGKLWPKIRPNPWSPPHRYERRHILPQRA